MESKDNAAQLGDPQRDSSEAVPFVDVLAKASSEVKTRKIEIDDYHRPYLIVQNGQLDKLSGDRVAWELGYQAHMRQTLLEMIPVLPKYCGALLDIGSGLGGIEILLNDWYGCIPYMMLVDGKDDAPVVRTHNQTFNSHDVSESFLMLNRVRRDGLIFCDPKDPWPIGPVATGGTWDLVISLNSWCFHYAPDWYIEKVMDRCHKGTKIIVDVRRHKHDWNQQMCTAFKEGPTILQARKFSRKVFTL